MGDKFKLGLTLTPLAVLGYMWIQLVLSGGSYDPNLLTSEQMTQRLNARPAISSVEHQQRRKYAIVINGDTSKLHQGNVTEAYKSLKHLGFADENIFLLTSNFPREDDNKSITTPATEQNLRRVFYYLDNVVDDNDLVLVYTTGHGGTIGGQSTLALADKEILSSNLKDIVKSTKAGDYVIVADQCFSGGIAQSLSELEGEVTSFSSTDAGHSTYCRSFARPFWTSFRTCEADANQDGTTTLDEAFSYASQEHKRNVGLLNRIFGSGTNRDCQEYRTLNSPNSLE